MCWPSSCITVSLTSFSLSVQGRFYFKITLINFPLSFMPPWYMTCKTVLGLEDLATKATGFRLARNMSFHMGQHIILPCTQSTTKWALERFAVVLQDFSHPLFWSCQDFFYKNIFRAFIFSHGAARTLLLIMFVNQLIYNTIILLFVCWRPLIGRNFINLSNTTNQLLLDSLLQESRPWLLFGSVFLSVSR